MSGTVHLYTGDGKGKTTCAMGLALRAAGHGKRVVIAQFLKDGRSGERLAFARFPNVKLLPVPERTKFVFAMTAAEKEEAAEDARGMLRAAERLMGDCDLLVLDEVCAAVSTGLLSPGEVADLLDGRPGALEVVLTGRDPAPELLSRADYVTEMQKRKHPLDRGAAAREGIEY